MKKHRFSLETLRQKFPPSLQRFAIYFLTRNQVYLEHGFHSPVSLCSCGLEVFYQYQRQTDPSMLSHGWMLIWTDLSTLSSGRIIPTKKMNWTSSLNKLSTEAEENKNPQNLFFFFFPAVPYWMK